MESSDEDLFGSDNEGENHIEQSQSQTNTQTESQPSQSQSENINEDQQSQSQSNLSQNSNINGLQVSDDEADLFGDDEDIGVPEQTNIEDFAPKETVPPPPLPPKPVENLKSSRLVNCTMEETPEPDRNVPMHLLLVSNIFDISPDVYDPNTFDEAAEENRVTQKKGIAGLEHAVIRYKYAKDEEGNELIDEKGNKVLETNTRIVKWEDGSFQLQVGEESYNLDFEDISSENGFLYGSQIINADGNSTTYLAAKGPIDYKLIVTPESESSLVNKVIIYHYKNADYTQEINKNQLEPAIYSESKMKQQQEKRDTTKRMTKSRLSNKAKKSKTMTVEDIQEDDEGDSDSDVFSDSD